MSEASARPHQDLLDAAQLAFSNTEIEPFPAEKADLAECHTFIEGRAQFREGFDEVEGCGVSVVLGTVISSDGDIIERDQRLCVYWSNGNAIQVDLDDGETITGQYSPEANDLVVLRDRSKAMQGILAVMPDLDDM